MSKLNLLLLPGLVNDERLWQHQVDTLGDIASVIVADLTGANSMAGLAASVLTQAPAGPFALAGLSMGGYTAFEIMRQAPERVLALALLDTSARPDTPESTAGRQKMIAQAQIDYAGVIDSLLPKFVHPDHLKDVHQIEIIKAMANKLGKDVFKSQQEAIIGRADSRPLLAKIQCPTLVLCGLDDVVTPVEIHEEMHAAITGSRLMILDNCGHLSPLGKPQQVSDAVREWLLTIN